MEHTADYALVPYITIILQYSEILAYYCFFLTAAYGTLKAAISQSMVLCASLAE